MAPRRMDRVWIGSGAAASVLIAAAGWLFFVSPQLDAKAESEQQIVDAQTQNIVLQQKISRLQAQSERAGELTDQLDAVRAGVPTQHDMDAFTRQLSAQAQAAGVTITSIAPGQPTPIISRSAAPAPAADSAASGTDTAPPSDTEPAAPAAGDAAAPTADPIYSIAVTLVTSGPMDGQRQFLSLMEKQGPRRALVVSTSFSADGGPSAPAADSDATAPASWTMTTQLQLFVAPKAPASDPAAAAEPAAHG